ncbi:acyl-CoA dehydrogenase [Ochrobactrum pecoris]|uniref:Acyl-CoA dehydrogenase n=1 Tax=Brucella pecoris TaxID=867683 RepID=A0A5C5CCM1_9HYPH|nr:acyl-CoA dehydrogenase family protein [Brucella pecoris]MBB4095885.1 acyl-CoA dehydrogenase [Brucella pecoris]NKW82670.1 acyl-CoA dehydrogenase [Brucella pecoris]TNV09093.1 acyl-CoA dehydrogenase [Brucella pecoris]
MDLRIDARTEDYRRRIAHFVDNHILPLEQDPSAYDAHENIHPDVLARLRQKARSEGLWCLQLSENYGGQGLSRIGMAVCYEEMNRSIFGPVVFNSAAPDDGNMMVLETLGTKEQKEWFLRPIAAGKVNSAFAMTEPDPGSGSDPGMMQTVATRDGDDFLINGHKWFITGAETAEHFIVVARTSENARRGHTCFLFHRDEPGWSIRRRIPIMGPEEHGGHCELVFEGLRVPSRNILLAEGQGLRVVQTRLGIARLTHCMRWLGLAKRCVEIATEYADRRRGFGVRLADRESVQILLGGLAMDIEIGRLLVMKAAWALDQGSQARKEVSMAKIHVAQLLNRAADTAIQVNGARGYSKDTRAEWIYRYARQARLVDGADEVHKMVLHRNLIEEKRDFWKWDVAGGQAK